MIDPKRFMRNVGRDLESPVNLEPKWAFFGGNRVRVLIINEDQSAEEFWVRFAESYIFTVRGRDYFFVSRAVLRMKYPLCVYFYNNPFPVFLQFTKSQFAASKMLSEAELSALPKDSQTIFSNLVLDSEAVHLGFNARIFDNLYSRKGVPAKVILIFIIVGIVVLIVFLQLFGVIDIFKMLGMKK